MAKYTRQTCLLKIETIISVTLFLTAILFLPSQTAAQETDYYSKKFEWDYGGHHWTWSINIPKALYGSYKDVPVSTRTRNGLAGYGFLTTTEDPYIQALAQKLNETASQMEYGSYDAVSFVLAFVQSLPYTSDKTTEGYDEYPRFPVETLVDGGGDCEDTSILFATLTLIMNYGTIYISPPNHYAVGVLGDNLPSGYYWTVNDKTYYYCETTGDGFKIGDLPDEYQNQTAHTYTIRESQQYVPNIQIEPVQPHPSTEHTQTATQTPLTHNPLNFAFNDVAIIILGTVLIAVVVGVLAFSICNQTKRRTQIPPTPQPTDTVTKGRYCVYCGALNSSESSFCSKCGQRMT